MQRRDFLIRSGFALGASAAAGLLQRRAVASPQSIGPVDREASDWGWVRNQFSLSRDYVHLAGFLLASHPRRVAQAIETHRRRLDENPADYWHENMGRFEADARSAAAQYLATSPELIALTDSTTMGLGLVYGSLTLKPGQEILSTVHDHYSTDMSLRHRAKRTGTTLRRIPLYRDIQTVSVDEIVQTIVGALTPRTRIVAVTWVHSSTGLKLPIRAIADALAEVNAQRDPDERALLCVDGVHGFGVDDVTMDKLGCDFFIAGTHKWMFGPRGTGIICGRPEAWEAANVIIPSFEMQTFGIWLGLTEPQHVPGGIAMTPGGFHSFEHRWAVGEAFRFPPLGGGRGVPVPLADRQTACGAADPFAEPPGEGRPGPDAACHSAHAAVRRAVGGHHLLRSRRRVAAPGRRTPSRKADHCQHLAIRDVLRPACSEPSKRRRRDRPRPARDPGDGVGHRRHRGRRGGLRIIRSRTTGVSRAVCETPVRWRP